MRIRFWMHFGLAAFVTLAPSCGDGNDAVAGCRPTAEPRFILSSQDGIGEMRLDGSRRTILKWDDQTAPLDPAVSPDCKRIAFAVQPPARPLPDGNLDFGSDIAVAGIDGKGERQVAKHQRLAEFLRTPVWLSNDELLYTYRGRNNTGQADIRIERLDLSTGRSSRFLESAIDPSLAAERDRIVYVALDPRTDAETLTVADIDLRNARGLADSTNNLGLFSAHVFSPDGSRIAFAAVDLSAPLNRGRPPPSGSGIFAAHPFAQDIWTVNADGTGLRRLAEIAENMPSIAWAADGRHLYVMGPASFWRIDAASGEATKIAQGVPLGQIAWLSGP